MKTVGLVDVKITYKNQPSRWSSSKAMGQHYWDATGSNTFDWIKTVVESDGLRQLLQENEDLFTDELGTITPIRAKLEVSPSATPKVQRTRPVPYAVKPLVEQELDRLEKAGVIERVDGSEWAAPIVTVLKRDGRVRICGDYEVTVNPVVDIDQYNFVVVYSKQHS